MTTSKPANYFSFDFIRILLRGTGQVMFQNSAWTGLFFLIGIFWGAYAEGQGLVAWGALVGVIVSTITGYLLGFPDKDGEQGLWGFNGVLVGCAFPTFMGSTIWMWLALILCAALTTWVRTGFNNVMAPWKVNSFTFPFVFCTWMFLLAARAMHGMPTTHMSDPALPGAFSSMADIGFGHLIVYWLKGIAQVFLINSWVTGIFFLIGLALSNRWAALWAAIGSAIALFVALIFKASGSDIANGLYGFSAVLTAIALATVFYKPNGRSALWAILGILVTLFIQAGMNSLMAPVGIATLTGPFCIATWLFLLPLIKFDDKEKPDHSNWDPDNKTHLATSEQNGVQHMMQTMMPDKMQTNAGAKPHSDNASDEEDDLPVLRSEQQSRDRAARKHTSDPQAGERQAENRAATDRQNGDRPEGVSQQEKRPADNRPEPHPENQSDGNRSGGEPHRENRPVDDRRNGNRPDEEQPVRRQENGTSEVPTAPKSDNISKR